MKAIRLILAMLLTAVTCCCWAQGIIIYKSNGTQEKLPYITIDSIIMYYGDKDPVPVVEAKPVDLGLPSGTLWASHNVGATAPEVPGGYYAYGETKEKAAYSWDSYMCPSASACGTSNDPLYKDGLLKVADLSIKCNVAGTQYDVATQTWDESWVIPTLQQFQELTSNCTISSVTINDVRCIEYTGSNGNSVIFPCSGGYKQNTQTLDADYHSYYWTAEMDSWTSKKEAMYALCGTYGINYGQAVLKDRFIGMQVRPVKKK